MCWAVCFKRRMQRFYLRSGRPRPYQLMSQGPSSMATRSVSQEAKDIKLASSMIRLGARLQVLQAETALSYERLARLYREVRGDSPPKGMLPFSADWFTTWLPNIHSTIFISLFDSMCTPNDLNKWRPLVKTFYAILYPA